MPTGVVSVIEEIKARQKSEGLSNELFARKIGISRQMWEFVLNGTREPGLKVWRGIVRAYPDLAGTILTGVTDQIFAESKK
jgi:transcriptional regulator with XRE-family HTH domain